MQHRPSGNRNRYHWYVLRSPCPDRSDNPEYLHDKEPISTKGPRLTGEISFAGRYLVLMPFGDKVSVSSKIKSGEERSRLKQLIHSIKPKNCGVIVRTVAEGKKVAELDAELKVLVKRWEDAIAKVQKTQQRPQLAFEETGRAVALLRDLFNPSYENIYVNNEDVMNEVKNPSCAAASPLETR